MSANVTAPGESKSKREGGLRFWMQRVLEECERVRQDFAADPVHDLRVALRRCRSMADGVMAIDPDKSWKAMKKAGKPLFRALGDLRDAHVMQETMERLGMPEDPVTKAILDFATTSEYILKQQALKALDDFDQKRWNAWSKTLPQRAARIRPSVPVFKHIALERWTEARHLQTPALRTRSQMTLHNLRIAIKRFRYIVENFLPDLHDLWIEDLKYLQDLLGEVHDLDVLWSKALELNAFPGEAAREHWAEKIAAERTSRIECYREKTVSNQSLWRVWRVELPRDQQIQAAACHRLRIWASFLDPDVQHSRRVADFSLQLYDKLAAADLEQESDSERSRALLRMAALMHDVGRSRKEKAHHKRSLRLIRSLSPPLGWTAADMHLTAVVARYHRGALPQPRHKDYAELPADQQTQAVQLAAILRLANAFDSNYNGRIKALEVRQQNGFLVVAAEGYSPRDPAAETIASARHLMELVYHKPVIVRRRAPKRKAASKQRPSKRRAAATA